MNLNAQLYNHSYHYNMLQSLRLILYSIFELFFLTAPLSNFQCIISLFITGFWVILLYSLILTIIHQTSYPFLCRYHHMLYHSKDTVTTCSSNLLNLRHSKTEIVPITSEIIINKDIIF